MDSTKGRPPGQAPIGRKWTGTHFFFANSGGSAIIGATPLHMAYDENSIKTLDWREHIRMRPGMYIGKLGDGTSPDDGIYVLLKEVIDNSIDEFVMGFGKKITIDVTPDGLCEVRDFGRGIPLGKLLDCAAKINTGAKYDSDAFKKSVGLNGVGIKAVNALSDFFEIQAYRDGETRSYQFCRGKELPKGRKDGATEEPNGTRTAFHADPDIFPVTTQFRPEYIEKMCRYYSYLNKGLALHFNGRRYVSKNGLLDLLTEAMSEEPLYPIIHLEGHDIEVAFTHGGQYGEEHYSFVNGQHTTQGGTHQAAFREAIVKTLRDFFKKNYEAGDIRSSLVAAISIKVKEPVFESQTKTKLGSNTISPEGETIRTFVGNFIARELDNYLHKNPETAKALEAKIKDSERDRKELSGIHDDNRYAAVVEFFAYHLLHLFVVLFQWSHYAQVCRINSKTQADGFDATCTCRLLSAGHGCCFVIRDDDRYVSVFVDAIEQSGHARVGECRVANDGYCRVKSCISSTFGHGNRCTHVYTRVDGVERSVRA